ncbi:MAG: hypothetical protein RMK29_18835 [Myxococcales bacterium]|nr:hypothetical protein [Myxococcota bacterium]MDW8283764.1 hypothetical protein [Myxococcales bacterium]
MRTGRLAMAVLVIASACTAPNPDFMMQTPCQAGLRQCVMTPRGNYPVVCGLHERGELTLLAERCPSSAACQAGLCVPPADAPSCTRQRDCRTGQVCVPLVAAEGRMLSGFCIPAGTGSAAPGQRCETDENCQTHLCLPFRNGNYCLRACRADQDCDIPDECRELNITVTGVAGRIRSCLPASR